MTRARLLGLAGVLAAGLGLPRAGEGQIRVVEEVRDAPVEAGGAHHPLMEPRPAVHPGDPRRSAVAAITRGPEGSPWHCAVYLTDDGGAAWSRHDFDGMERCIDPWALFLKDGTVLVSAVDIRSDAEGDGRFSLLLWRSEDGGRSWGGPLELGRTHEHPLLAEGTDGTLYLASRVTSPAPDGSPRHALHLATSRDGGRSFQERFRVVPGVHSVIPTGLVPLEEGRVALSYRDSNRNMATGEEGTSPTNRTWLLEVPPEGRGALEHRPVSRGCSTGALEEAFPGYPEMAGGPGPGGRGLRLYHACVRPGLVGVEVRASGDDGWSEAVRVDGGGEDAHVRTPMVAVNRRGVVGVAWYDRRQDPERDCQDVYFTASADGGRSFTEAVRVTTETSCPGVEGNGSAARSWPMGGDYGSLVAGPDGAFHLFWADSRSGRFRIRRAVLRVEG